MYLYYCRRHTCSSGVRNTDIVCYWRGDSGINTSCLERFMRTWVGVFTYPWNAELLQLHRSCICTAEMPAAFADIAAPILKLWVLYCESSSLAAFNVVHSKFLNEVHVNGDPSCMVVKSGPGCFPLSAKYGSNALIGQICEPVIFKHNLTPLRNRSVLDCLMVSHTTVGVCLLFTVISPRERWTELSYPFWLGKVISPTRRKPKKAIQHAAHSMIAWYWVGVLDSMV